jgi:hypothetical protein
MPSAAPSKPQSRAARGMAMERRLETEVDQELFAWAERSAAREVPAGAVSLPSTGHVLITEPQNLVLAGQEQLDRAYEELEEAHRR